MNMKEIVSALPALQPVLTGFLDRLVGHLMLVSYLLAVTDEQNIRERLKKLPPLLLSPLLDTMAAIWLFAVPEFHLFRYFLDCMAVFAMCIAWVMWAWHWDFRRAASAVCMAGILQVATSALAQVVFLTLPYSWKVGIAGMAAALLLSVAAAALLKRLRFGVWFMMLLEEQASLRRTGLLLFALEVSMEMFLILQNGVQSQYLAAYYISVIVLVIVILGLMIYLARWFDNRRTLQMQQDLIAQQQLYEQSLEEIRQEMRSFRHDYKNLLAGLSQQVEEGRMDALRAALSEWEADFDRHLGEKIQRSLPMGNLQVPQIRSLLLNKLTDMQKKGVRYHLEVLYPVKAIGMNIWDFVRCLGILTDNAVEAALDTGQPWVEMILLAQDRQVSLRISNPCTNAPDLGNIWNEGWSSRGAGRGLGLPGYQRIIKKYPNASTCTSCENGIFVQELTVEDRP